MASKFSAIVILTIGILIYQTLGNESDYELGSRNLIMHPENAFILRRCIATAELIRTRARKPVPKEVTEELPTGQGLPVHTEKPNTQTSKESLSVVMENRKPTNPLRFMAHLKSTPLTTVDIKSLRNRLPAFKKKSLLPELEHNVSVSAVNEPQNIIVIKPTV